MMPPAARSIFFIFFMGKDDEENKKNRAGSQQVVASVGWYSLGSFPGSRLGLLFPARLVAGAFLACVRLSSGVSSAVAVVAFVGLSLVGCQWLAPALGRARLALR
jgi:hypothetical protein